ncbi:MAG: hypothetical protein ABSG16_00005, partial [Candidatus Acidiferrum sp.]
MHYARYLPGYFFVVYGRISTGIPAGTIDRISELAVNNDVNLVKNGRHTLLGLSSFVTMAGGRILFACLISAHGKIGVLVLDLDLAPIQLSISGRGR